MDAAVLVNMMKNICSYFGKPLPKTETVQEWMKELKNIPNEPAIWIEQKIKSNKYPDNPPQSIRKLWFLWLEDNPEKQVKQKAGCSKCENGYLWTVKDGFNYVFRCEICNLNGYNQGIKASNRQEIKEKGFHLLWVHGSVLEIKSMPQYQSGEKLMSKGLIELLKNQFKPVYDQEWNNQF
jgi:hypothetical protein